MRFLSLFLFFSSTLFAQTGMDSYRWYLEPNGQEVLISIDDLHDETLIASPKLDWGKKSVPGYRMKKDVVIAVIDGGIDIEHPELKNHIAYNSVECYDGTTIPPKDGDDKDGNGYKGDCAGWDFVENTNRAEDQDGHGTHVTGIINAVLDGVQGSYKFLPIKTFAPDEGKSSTVKNLAPLSQRLVKAFNYALDRKVDIIHLSVGWPKAYMTYELSTTIKKVIDSGILVVAAAGNSSQRATIYPCQLEGVICVGALRPNGDVARFSNWGSQVDIYAPGEKILSTIPMVLIPSQISRKGYDYKNGTSQAAPFISGAVALLKGVYPEMTPAEIYGRLLNAADPMTGGKGLRGAFHLQKALDMPAASFIFPVMKGVNQITVGSRLDFSMTLPIKNFGALSSKRSTIDIECPNLVKPRLSFVIPSLKSGESSVIGLQGQLRSIGPTLKCTLKSSGMSFDFNLKVLKKFENPLEVKALSQDVKRPLVVKTRTGAHSRFMTLNTLKRDVTEPLYYIIGEANPMIYYKDQILGTITIKPKCRFLRLWQMDLNANGENDIMLETLCEDKFLRYEFYGRDLQEMFPGATYKPAIAVINYDDFNLILQKNAPPKFQFINVGFTVPSDDPWSNQSISKGFHYYEMAAVQDQDKNWSYQAKVLEKPESWAKDLGLRYLPDYQVLQHIGDRLLINMNRKTAWVDLKTQKATWAGLDHLLLEGSTQQAVINSSETILQTFLTPTEYRGFIIGGINLAYTQGSLFDPMMSVLSTTKLSTGYLTIIQTFQSLLYLEFDQSGRLVNKRAQVVDRFDFLSTQDLLSSIIDVVNNEETIQVVDGTKLNTSYVDVVKHGDLRSFEIPFECVTHQPVTLDGKVAMPVFCSTGSESFEMRFYSLE